ncbi:peptidase domain-containing ABC transporter [Thalassotalea ponticola]|uniref:peptidase domain-containing ABC transporter n=1 Tax=Thalassotalea ponticola TaxID=1523392 RepID=UPI0025B56BBE|nr:peptidase domain-containing ABC transporter [Thalassotalea ponticola]MDN3653289.1 peptidase domain-containing ABC transporter [Thalassotalea ponticola]
MSTNRKDAANGLAFFQRRRLPVMLQSESSECGLACLAMIANFFGFNADLASLRRIVSLSPSGARLSDLMSAADQLKLTGRALKLSITDIRKLNTPCILHWDLNHFVVLKHCVRGGVVIHDPAIGEQKLSVEQVSEHFTGIALELTPSDAFTQAKLSQSLTLSDFTQQITGLWPTITKILALSVMLQLFAIAAPYYLQLVIDDVIVNQDDNLLTVLALGFALVALFELLTRVLRSVVVLHFSSVMNLQMASQLCHHLLRLPVAFFQRRHMGDIVSRFGSLDAVRQLLSNGLVEALVDGLMIVAVLLMMFLYSVKLTVLVLLAVVAYAALRWLCYKPLKQLNEQQIVAKSKEQSCFMENIRAIETIKLRQCESARQQVWLKNVVSYLNLSIEVGKLKLHFTWLHDVIFAAENIAVVYVAALCVIQGQLSLGMLTAFIAYKRQFTSKVILFIDRVVEMKMLSLHLNRIADIALAEQEPHFQQRSLHLSVEPPNMAKTTCEGVVTGACLTDENQVYEHQTAEYQTPGYRVNQGLDNQRQRPVLAVSNLAFRYHQQQPFLFENVSFSVFPGQCIAITGASGRGKTSLLKLLMGLEQPSRGEVCYLEQNIEHVGIGTYRSKLAAVLQNDQLISGSLIDNITFFSEQVDLPRLHECLARSQLLDEIKRMPMGLETLVGDMGSSLSGGQKQRLLLARALYQQPEILFLDEATSHLDSENEMLVSDAIKSLDTTRIVVAHRIETIIQADVILTLTEQGVIDVTEKMKSPCID